MRHGLAAQEVPITTQGTEGEVAFPFGRALAPCQLPPSSVLKWYVVRRRGDR